MTYNARNGFLTAQGLKQAAQRDGYMYGVDGMAPLQHLGSRVSVSGLEQERNMYVHDDEYIDSQYRRFHSGS